MEVFLMEMKAQTQVVERYCWLRALVESLEHCVIAVALLSPYFYPTPTPHPPHFGKCIFSYRMFIISEDSRIIGSR
jgi:hypothetical protein